MVFTNPPSTAFALAQVGLPSLFFTQTSAQDGSQRLVGARHADSIPAAVSPTMHFWPVLHTAWMQGALSSTATSSSVQSPVPVGVSPAARATRTFALAAPLVPGSSVW